MPTKNEHRRKIAENEAFYSDVSGNLGSYDGWQVTTLFYAALHYVDAYLDSVRSIHPKRHDERDSLVSREASLKQISTEYLTLKDRSIDARYEAIQFPVGFAKQKYDNEYTRIKNHIEPLL